MSDNLYEGPCEAGCQRFHGGETRHDKCCGYYPESLTKAFEDKIETLTARIRELEQGVGVTHPTPAQLDDACLSYDHSYGLMSVDDRESLRRECADWFRCLSRALTPAPVTVQEAARVLLDQPYDVMKQAFYAMERMQGEGSDRIMAAALSALAGQGGE